MAPVLLSRSGPAAILCALALSACTASSPDVDAPGQSGFDAGGIFADTVMAFGPTGAITSCTESLPPCGESPPACGANDVLGAPDDTAYNLPAGGVIEIAFRCSQIVERGQSGDEATSDLQVLANLDSGARAIVEVSFDGSVFETLDILDESDQLFDLSRGNPALEVVRFLRITDGGSGGIAIDAISALR